MAGFRVDDRVFKILKSYYPLITERNGSFKYDKHNHFAHEPREGRSIASILALMNLGVDVAKKHPVSLKYARANIEKTMTHHTPSVHMTLCAFTFHALGEKDWKAYVKTYFRKLIARQREDGSLDKVWDPPKKLVMQPNDLAWGATYATAHFALILQIAGKRVSFYKQGGGVAWPDAIDDALKERSKPVLVLFVDEKKYSKAVEASFQDGSLAELLGKFSLARHPFEKKCEVCSSSRIFKSARR